MNTSIREAPYPTTLADIMRHVRTYGFYCEDAISFERLADEDRARLSRGDALRVFAEIESALRRAGVR